MIPLQDVIPTRTRPFVTTALVIVNALLFALPLALSPTEAERFIARLGLVPAAFSIVTVFTSMFVHGGFGHLGLNLLYLWIFGDNVEARLGHGRFAAFYLATGAIAALAQTAMDPASPLPIVGASGAIAGLLGGYFVLYPSSRVLTLFPIPLTLFEVPAVFFLGLWFVVQLLSGLASPAAAAPFGMPGGVAFWAHVMGFGAGAALVKLLERPERARVDWWGP
jgi:membrane associated rhomboid family serine protease